MQWSLCIPFAGLTPAGLGDGPHTDTQRVAPAKQGSLPSMFLCSESIAPSTRTWKGGLPTTHDDSPLTGLLGQRPTPPFSASTWPQWATAIAVPDSPSSFLQPLSPALLPRANRLFGDGNRQSRCISHPRCCRGNHTRTFGP